MFLHYAPFWLKAYFRKYTWHIPTSEKVIYLTFDDGPIPDITEYVLKTLKDYDAKATFFCIGDNVRKHPQIFNQLLLDGHSVGNHTFNHLNGWKNEDHAYLDNIARCDRLLTVQSYLFRPPYGRIKSSQAKQLTHKRIVMWDVLSGDFSPKVSPEQCLEKSIRYTKAGSIVLFHDSIKASRNMQAALPAYLDYFIRKGFRFEALPMTPSPNE
ncbi:polysaccharide deacetylase family protein [Dyadobacter tibetensis]|uniref:polysaccharide deacetylase family protein n=1 Tax=Dyadobacter tibetensis TaxID=1211851 RepID=UPI000470EF88|nr:polysaccharide deacetylase family protein [Dyadobacter tibetensis]